MQQAEEAKLLSSEHFSVDGTLIRAWVSIKSFVPKNGPPPEQTGSESNPEADFKRQKAATIPKAPALPPDFFSSNCVVSVVQDFLAEFTILHQQGVRLIDVCFLPVFGNLYHLVLNVFSDTWIRDVGTSMLCGDQCYEFFKDDGAFGSFGAHSLNRLPMTA
jgi:hypothetical protein